MKLPGRAGWWASLGCLLMLAVGLMGAVFLVQIPALLAVGWVRFLARSWGLVVVDPVAVTAAVVLAAVVFAGTHLVFVRAARALSARPWSLRHTALVDLLVVAMFLTAMSVIGIVHQAGWLVTSPDPFIESSWRHMQTEQRRYDVCRGVKTWEEFADEWHVVPRADDPGERLVFARDPIERRTARFGVCSSEGKWRSEPPEALPERLREWLSPSPVDGGRGDAGRQQVAQ